MSGLVGVLECRLEILAPRALQEFVAYPSAHEQLLSLGWPCVPGEVREDEAGMPVLLYFAPARWLVAGDTPVGTGLLAAAVESQSGVAVDVQGKWTEMILSGAEATRALASTVDIEALLDERGCVAITAFDCPAIIARATSGYRIWVGTSHAADFAAAIERLTRGT